MKRKIKAPSHLSAFSAPVVGVAADCEAGADDAASEGESVGCEGRLGLRLLPPR